MKQTPNTKSVPQAPSRTGRPQGNAAETSRPQGMFGTMFPSLRAGIEAVRADGGTRHFEAIMLALRLRPDVMFLLTDGEAADDLTAAEFDTLTRALAGTTCMVVQFGGEGDERSPNLARLAALSGGKYAVIDPAAD